MPLSAGAVHVDVLPNTDKFAAQMQGRMASIGSTLTKTVTPVAAGLAVAFKQSFDEWNAGIDSIRVGTGKTGKALKGLETSFKKVAGRVTQPLSEVGKVMSDLARRTGLTGKPLENLTKQVLDLARITGGDAQASVAGITRLFGDWGVKTEQMTPTLDKLFRVSQQTGIGLDQLSGLMVQFGAPLRNLGLDFDTSAAMFAKFEQEGVNIQTVLPGLRMALKNFAAAGREPAPALLETFNAIRNAGSEAKANTLAFEIFGTRAGPDLAAAIREGRFDFGELISKMQNGRDTITTATADTTDLADRFKMMRNRIVTLLGPFGEIGSIAFGTVAAIGPLIFGIGQLNTALKGTVAASILARIALIGLMTLGIGLVIGAVVALVVVIVKNWDRIVHETRARFQFVAHMMGNLWRGIKNTVADIVGGLLAFLVRSFASFLRFWINIAGGIIDAAAAAFGWIGPIGDKIKGFQDQFHRTSERILADLERQAGKFDGWGDKAAGDILRVAGEWRNLRELMSGPIKAGVIHGVGKFAPGGGSGFGPGMGLVPIGQRLQAGGFTVAGHPSFPPIGGHVQGSYHYLGRAIDVNWPNKATEPGKLAQLAGAFQSSLGSRIKEMFWPGYDPVGGHSGPNAHLHLAMDRGGIVKGPAMIHQGAITEAHIPLTGPGAVGMKIVGTLNTPFGPAEMEATVVDMLSDGEIVSRAIDRKVWRLGG